MNKKWLTEPNEKHWEYRGVKCHILRHPVMLHLCGYVTAPAGHPWYEKPYDDIDVRVHGGLTFKGFLDSKQDMGYVVGFDCAHAGDLIPELDVIKHGGDVYRDIEYVTACVEELASEMLAQAEPEDGYYLITQEELDKMKAIIKRLYSGTDRERDYAKMLDAVYRTMGDCPAKKGDVV